MTAEGSQRRWRRGKLIGGLILLAVAAGAACWLLYPGDYRRPGANVLLVVIDTLRADHLGCYGYDVATSPAVDRFARDAVLFETTVAAAPSTEPSHASMFTSLSPSHHGAWFARRGPLGDEHVTWAEILAEGGYRTVSFNDGGQVNALWGLDQGFAEYVSFPGKAIDADFERNAKRAIAWLEQPRDEPFFMFLHTYETHHPYDADQRFFDAIGHRYDGPLPAALTKDVLEGINRSFGEVTQADGQHIVAAYDAEIRSMDETFAWLVERLRALELYDDTLIIFTSDHGEELGERSKFGWHSHALYDEQLLVPLLIKLPRGHFAGSRVARQVRGIDLLPTVLDILDLPPRSEFEGRTAMPLVEARPDAPRPAVAQRDVPTEQIPVALRTERWKYYLRAQHGQTLLFDLAVDPLERENLATNKQTRLDELKTRLGKLLLQRPTAERLQPAALPDQLRQQLESLGYLEGQR